MLADERDVALLNQDEKPGESRREIKLALEKLIQDFENEEQSARQKLLREIKKNDLYFRGEQDIWWDEVSEEYVSSLDAYREGLIGEAEFKDYTRTVNIVRAHGESIIAASSVEVPKVRYFPADASRPADIVTARAYSKIEEKIALLNDAKQLIRNTFFILWKEHFAAAYIRAHKDKKYGVLVKDVFKPIIEDVPQQFCPECNSPIPEMSPEEATEVEPVGGEPAEMMMGEEMGPEVEPLDMESMMAAQGMTPPTTCPTCEAPVVPQTRVVPMQTGQEKVDEEAIVKCGIKIEIYGSKNVKIPYAAKTLTDCPYLIFEREIHRGALIAEYPELKDKLNTTSDLSYDERTTRLTRSDLRSWNTLKLAWIRPWAYNCLETGDQGIIDELNKHYPDGALVILVNDKAVDCVPSLMDDHWEFTESSVSDRLHADPLCKPLIPIQELKTELYDYTMETIRHAVTETFADPAVVNFQEYGRHAVEPGMMTPARPRPGMTLDNSFYQTKGATLSQEVAQFSAEVEAAGQFSVGSFPSIYGGREEAGSETATEYMQSRQQALQRLGITWEMVNSWWPRVQGKAIKLYRANFQGQDSFVKPVGGGFENVDIKEEDLIGDVGEILPESNSGFPTSWVEKRQMLFNLMDQKLEPLNATIFHPENAGKVKDLFGFFDFYIPGDDDRNKQLEEIVELLKSKPMEQPPSLDPISGEQIPGIPQPTIPTEPEVDDEDTHVRIIKAWAVSEQGRRAKLENPGGYSNVMAHLAMHVSSLNAQMAAAPPPAEGEGEGNGEVTQ